MQTQMQVQGLLSSPLRAALTPLQLVQLWLLQTNSQMPLSLRLLTAWRLRPPRLRCSTQMQLLMALPLTWQQLAALTLRQWACT
jgi:hypothetical protein